MSIDWYLKSCRAAIVEAEALVHLAIALESLLHVHSGQGVTERFKDAILTLLGPVPRLDVWVEQFYTARSKAVHEGVPADIMFYPFDKDLLKKKRTTKEPIIPHRSLLEYGRRIFRLCLASVLAGATHVRLSRLDALFVPNQERIEAICKGLNQQLTADKGLLTVSQQVYELRDEAIDLVDPDIVKVACVLGAVKLALRAYRDAGVVIAKAADEAIEKVLTASSEPSLAVFALVEEIGRQLRAGRASTGQCPDVRLTDIVIALLEYASKPSFKLYCYLKENPTSSQKLSESS